MSLPINGNQYFTRVENLASQPQSIAADSLQCTFFGSALSTAPANTGPTGPFSTIPYAGQVVLASTGPVGGGPNGAGIYVYTGSKWLNTTLTQ